MDHGEEIALVESSSFARTCHTQSMPVHSACGAGTILGLLRQTWASLLGANPQAGG